MEVALVVGRYTRRMIEIGKAHIQQEIERAGKEGDEVDGAAIGRAAAEEAARDYFGALAGRAPERAIEASTNHDES